MPPWRLAIQPGGDEAAPWSPPAPLAEGVARRFGFIAGELDTMDDMRHCGAAAAAASELPSVALRVPSAALERLVAIVQGRASFPNVGSEAFVRLMLAADELAADDLVGRFVGAVADSIRGKTVEQVRALFAGVSELTEDLVHKVLDRMPLSAAVMLCEEWVARSAAAAFMDAGTASRKARALALDAQRAVQPFALQTPVTEEHVRAAEALIAEHGARGADCVHRALEAFAPGGRVLRASDLRHCIRIRAEADAQLGPWMVAAYAASRDQAPAVDSVVSSARERVRRVVHIEGPSGSGKTEVSTSIYANVARTIHGRLLEERKRKRAPAAANVLYLTNTNILKDTWNNDVGVPEADRAPTKPGRSVKSFIYEVYQKRNRLHTSQIAIATSAAKVSPVNHPLLGRVSAAEIWAVMDALNNSPMTAFGGDPHLVSQRKLAIAQLVCAPRSDVPLCFGGLTRWVINDSIARVTRGDSLELEMDYTVAMLDEVQCADEETRAVVAILAASNCQLVLMGDRHQALGGAKVNLFADFPAAPGASFALRCSFRFGAEGASAYNTCLVPSDVHGRTYPLISGLGPAVPYVAALPDGAERVVCVGPTNVGALLALRRTRLPPRAKIYVKDSILPQLHKLRRWLVSPPSAVEAAAVAGDGEEEEAQMTNIWQRFFRETSREEMAEFLAFYAGAIPFPTAGAAAVPAGPCGIAIATQSAIGSNMKGFVVVPLSSALRNFALASAVTLWWR